MQRSQEIDPRGGRISSAIWISMAAFVCWQVVTTTAQAQTLTVDQIVREMRAARDKLLKLPQGFSVEYAYRVNNTSKDFVFQFDSCTGRLSMKWPVLYGNCRGFDLQFHVWSAFEFEYNFETNCTYDNHGSGERGAEVCTNVRLAPYKTAYIRNWGIPLYLQHFDEVEWTPQQKKDSLYLPAALAIHASQYSVRGRDRVGGIDCVKLERPGFDVIWLSPKHGYMVVKREIYYGPGKPFLERSECSDFRPVGDGGWMAGKIHAENGFPDTSAPDLRGKVQGSIDYHVTKISLNPKAAELRIRFPPGATIDDQIRGRQYTVPAEDDPGFPDRLVNVARGFAPAPRARFTFGTVGVWVNIAILLGVACVLLWRRLTGRDSNATPNAP
jgi:hypothetical protein